MASRRTFLKAGLGACATSAVIVPGEAQSTPVAYYKVIFDERFAGARAFANAAAARGISTVAIRGDITKLFFDDLDLRWKRGPVVLAGYTTPASLFCLDLLARDRGMRVSHRVTRPDLAEALRALDDAPLRTGTSHVPSNDPLVPVLWVIQPHVSVKCLGVPGREDDLDRSRS
jgi:hypothetical protein